MEPTILVDSPQMDARTEVTGLPARWHEAAPETVREQLVAATGDGAFADHAMAYWSALTGQPELVTHAVEEITGAPARTFRDWAREHARDFLTPGQDERR